MVTTLWPVPLAVLPVAVAYTSPSQVRAYQDFPVADELMRQSVFVGCHAELTFDQINYMADVIDDGLNAAVLRDAA